ncbi:MAG TPA: TIGR04211 family SH3 domain-containing protein [Desulfuromonas sp.]|nr:TIGR04211 family SH3 domain-containing protein [Desulfuromonas sp.]
MDMPRFFVLVLFTAFCQLLPTMAAAAETRYVTDMLFVSLRQGPADNAPALTTLQSGNSVEVLADQGRFLKVKTPSGAEGYILKQYLVVAAPKAAGLAGLEKERDRLRDELASAERERKAATAALDELRKTPVGKTAPAAATPPGLPGELEQVKSDLDESRRKYEALVAGSRDVIGLTKERDQLRKETARLTAELDTLRAEGAKLGYREMIPWFLAGGGVLFFGWILGKMSRQKRRF